MSRDKRITTRQAILLVQNAYDRYEALALQVLREEFEFGAEEIARFEEAFSERAAECDARLNSGHRESRMRQ